MGGILKAIHGNIRIGHSPYFVAEACEYTNSFLKFHPKMEIILNIEEDHLDSLKIFMTSAILLKNLPTGFLPMVR